MASNSKSTTLYSSGGHAYTLSTSFNETGTNTSGNYSTIDISATLSSTGYRWTSSYNSTLRLYWHDNRENYDRWVSEVSATEIARNGSISTSGSITVYHNSDGNVSGYAYASWEKGGTSSYTPNSGGVTTDWTALTSIPRQATVTGYWDFNDEGNPRITYTNPGGFRINARLEFGGTSIRRDNISNTGSYTFSLTNAERTLLRQKCTGNSMTVRGVIATCIGGTTENYWSYWDRTMTMVNANPTFSNFVFQDTNTTTLALTGNSQNIIRGYSNVQVTIPVADKAIAIKEATMSKYRFTCGDSSVDITYNANTDVSGTINGVQNGTFNVYATDSRNNSTLATKLANQVMDYTPLTKGNIEVNRSNGVSEETTLTLNGTIDLIDFGEAVNSIQTSKYRYKTTDSSSWSNYINITLTVDENGNFSFEDEIDGDEGALGFDINNSYNIEVLVEDELSSITYTDTLNSGIPNIALAKDGVGIMGKYDDEVGGKLQVAGENIQKKKVATAYLSSEVYNIKNNWIPFSAITSNTNKLTLSDNGIRIGKNISKILVSGNVFLAAGANNSYLWTATKKVSSNGNWDIGIAIDNYNTYFASTCHAPHIVDVVEGDVIKILKIDDASGTIRGGGNTYLTVEVIEEG